MKYIRAVLFGAVAWALVFVEWSILAFTPGVKDIGNWQWVIHFLVLIAIISFVVSIYGKGKYVMNGLLLGAIMLVTGIVLDAIISMPLFIAPQGTSYSEFFLNPWMLVGYVEFLALTWYLTSRYKHETCKPCNVSTPTETT